MALPERSCKELNELRQGHWPVVLVSDDSGIRIIKHILGGKIHETHVRWLHQAQFEVHHCELC